MAESKEITISVERYDELLKKEQVLKTVKLYASETNYFINAEAMKAILSDHETK